jgi:hypothetical protein
MENKMGTSYKRYHREGKDKLGKKAMRSLRMTGLAARQHTKWKCPSLCFIKNMER